MLCGEVNVEDSRENEKSPIVVASVFAFDFDSDAILVGYLIHAEHTERLHRYNWKVKTSSFPEIGRAHV